MNFDVNILRQIVLFDFNLVLLLYRKFCLLVRLLIVKFESIRQLLLFPLGLFLVDALIAEVPAARPAVVEELAPMNATGSAPIAICAAVPRR